MPAPKGNKNAVGNKGGRPKTTIDVLWEGWQDDILDLYENGSSDVQVRAFIYKQLRDTDGGKCARMSFNLWNRWIEEEIEFCEIIKIGHMLSEAWWLDQGKNNLKTGMLNHGLWFMNMKNRFDWSDKRETTLKGDAEDPLTAAISIKIKESQK